MPLTKCLTKLPHTQTTASPIVLATWCSVVILTPHISTIQKPESTQAHTSSYWKMTLSGDSTDQYSPYPKSSSLSCLWPPKRNSQDCSSRPSQWRPFDKLSLKRDGNSPSLPFKPTTQWQWVSPITPYLSAIWNQWTCIYGGFDAVNPRNTIVTTGVQGIIMRVITAKSITLHCIMKQKGRSILISGCSTCKGVLLCYFS